MKVQPLLIFALLGLGFAGLSNEHPAKSDPLPAEIQLFQPEDGRKVSSPFLVNALLNYGVDAPYWLELFGQDGRLLYRQVWTAPQGRVSSEDDSIPLLVSLDFGIPDTPGTESARLVITRLDEYGRPRAVSSVDLTLSTELSESTANPATTEDAKGRFLQEIVIQAPLPGDQVSAGNLLVNGWRKDSNKNLESRNLFTQLIAADGRIVGQRIASVSGNVKNGSGDHQFSAEIPYKVEAPTPVRLVVFEEGGQISPFRHLASIEVVLLP